MLDFFKDDKGQLSSMRLSCFLCLITALILLVYGTVKGVDVYAIVTMLLGISFTGKVTQKAIEIDGEKNKTDNEYSLLNESQKTN